MQRITDEQKIGFIVVRQEGIGVAARILRMRANGRDKATAACGPLVYLKIALKAIRE
jgi:hypothetical protein